MDAELEAIKEAVIAGDFDSARQLADAYVEANPAVFSEFKDLNIGECVKAVEVFRDANLAESQWRVEAWLLYHFEPQNIGGAAQVVLRKPGAV